MAFQEQSIKRQVVAAIMLTSLTVLVLAGSAFMVYDLVNFRQGMVARLSITAAMVAHTTTTARAFDNERAAQEVLAALHTDRAVVAAAIYDPQDHLYARYPAELAPGALPSKPGPAGARFESGHLELVEPIVEGETRYGTLYLKSSLAAEATRLRLYVGIALLVLAGTFLVALALSASLQRRIMRPIHALARTAQRISEQHDYSVRAPPSSTAELRSLTEAFNQMLARTQETEAVRSFSAALIDSTDDAIVGKDLQGRVVSWNGGAERMFGYTAAEMVGQSILRLVSPDRPEEEQRILERARQGEVQHFETVRRRKDGQLLSVSLTVSPIKNARGETIGISSISRDMTERHRAQQALERQAAVLREQAQMLDLANVLARDLDDRIILWNTGMETMYGWSKREALGKVSHELLRTEFERPLAEIRGQLLTTGHWAGELVHLCKDGRRLTVASQWILHTNEQGAPVAILEVDNDLTARKQAEEQIRRFNAELEQRVQERTAELTQANRELEAFTYSVAHDLRAPLRHVDAFARILSEDFGPKLPPDAHYLLENIRKGSRNMSRLVDDLLNLARVGRQELKCQRTALSDLVDEAVAELKRDTPGRNIEWRLHPLPAIECDAGLVKQVFANLLANAVKYTRTRPLAVIEVGTQEVNGGTALFVRDNGVGFNMKHAEKLFGLFQRLHHNDDFEGTGVGLATVDRIVRKHGGHVWAEAKEDQGATFYFDLPRG